MSTLSCKHRDRKIQTGFSLIDVMVGMTLGLIGILVMLQMLSTFESQKRTTSGSDDAQNSGAIAVYGIERDIRQAGYGIDAQRLLGCNILLRPGATLNAIGPVTINPTSIPGYGRDTNTDSIMVVYGNSNGPEEGDAITAQPITPNVYTVQTQPSYTVGDQVIAQYASRQTPCSLNLDTIQVVTPGDVNVTAVAGVATVMTTNTSPGITPVLYNLGQSPTVLVYAVRNGNLAVCDYMVNNCSSPTLAAINTANEAAWIPIAGNIVSLKAQYGRDTTVGPMVGIVDTYDQTTPSSASSTYTCDWARISAVRIALVARGSIGSSVTTAAPTWAGSAAAPIDLSSFANWKNYRYKVLETVVPMRNITMQGVVPGC